MKKEQLCDTLGEIDEAFIEEAEQYHANRRRTAFLRVAAIAACLCLVLTAVILPLVHRLDIPESPSEAPSGDLAPDLILDDKTYMISPYLEVSDTLPEGFAYAGRAPIGGFDSCDYYLNPAIPDWVYVHQEVYNNITGETPMKYVRYVDLSIRGKDFVCVDDVLYVSLWSISPTESPQLYARAQETYGIRIEGDAPADFISLGKALFSGWDTLPQGTLASNTGTEEVLHCPDDPDVLLVSTAWHTAPDETGEMRHTGWNVYIRFS